MYPWTVIDEHIREVLSGEVRSLSENSLWNASDDLLQINLI
jgi:hypothetical protein